jgi:thiaminase/transcriptional activator TenA
MAAAFDRLKAACPDDWQAYITHDFVRGMARGDLPEEKFRHYLEQDYLFLIQFARAYALAVYKSDSLARMRQAKAGLEAILDIEIGLHIDFCKGWGIPADKLEALPEHPACMAYTRYVLERGMAGDLTDLHMALAPCILGYGEVAQWMLGWEETRRDGNPYQAWIDMYAGEEYREVAEAEAAMLDELTADVNPQSATWSRWEKTFTDATRLEIGFWDMGLEQVPNR